MAERRAGGDAPWGGERSEVMLAETAEDQRDYWWKPLTIRGITGRNCLRLERLLM